MSLGIDPALEALVEAELIDQVRFTPRAEYAFRHPLIRAVAYESQLKADRAKLHRRLAAAIEAERPGIGRCRTWSYYAGTLRRYRRPRRGRTAKPTIT